MLKLFLKTFYLKDSSLIEEEKTKAYQNVLFAILIIHLVGLIIIGWFSYNYNLEAIDGSLQLNWKSFFKDFAGYLNYVVFTSGILIIMISLKNDTIVSQSYEFAAATTKATSHRFKDFNAHVVWISNNLSPTSFNTSLVDLTICISTPLYGVGVGEKSADLYFEFLSSWVKEYEKFNENPISKPKVTLCLWNEEVNKEIFKITDRNAERRNLIEKLIMKYQGLYQKLRDLSKEGKIDLKLYFSEKSDVRIFMVTDFHGNKYSGLFSIFSPLSDSSIYHKKWELTGFGFSDEKACSDVQQFVDKLSIMDYTKGLVNQAKKLDNSEKWLKEHMGLI